MFSANQNTSSTYRFKISVNSQCCQCQLYSYSYSSWYVLLKLVLTRINAFHDLQLTCHNNFPVWFSNGRYVCVSYIIFRWKKVFISFNFQFWIKASFNSLSTLFSDEILLLVVFSFSTGVQVTFPTFSIHPTLCLLQIMIHTQKKSTCSIHLSFHLPVKLMWITIAFPFFLNKIKFCSKYRG